MPHNKSSYHPFHLSTDRVFGDANGSRESLLLQMYTGEWISLYFPREVHFHLKMMVMMMMMIVMVTKLLIIKNYIKPAINVVLYVENILV